MRQRGKRRRKIHSQDPNVTPLASPSLPDLRDGPRKPLILTPTSVDTAPATPWRVLIVDDDADVHRVTQLALRRTEIEGRRLELLSAHSASQARELLSTESEIALVLLDVVMESQNAGLKLVRYIREELANSRCRIVLRTGQPNDVPEAEVMERYEINDYKTKTELTQTKLVTTIAAALRSYRDIVALESKQHELTKISRRLLHQATHDPLTGLSNRSEFERQLLDTIDTARVGCRAHAVCLIDLDKFRMVNDSFGHVAGDAFLREVSNLLQASIRKGDTAARIGGDEFALLLRDTSLADAAKIAGSIQNLIRSFRFTWADRSLNIGASMGVVEVTADCEGLIGLLQRAENLAYLSKELGGDRIQVSGPGQHEIGKRRDELEIRADLADAIETSALTLHHQVISPVRASNDDGDHYEVLVRMIAEDGSLLSPGHFLPVAEKYNLSVALDRWVTTNTLAWLQEHPVHVARLSMCSINLSASSLADEQFQAELWDLIQQTDVPASKLCFEITETAAITNMARAIACIENLRSLGCRFALDDFGTGFCSFLYLKNLPVDLVKIDGAFVRDILLSATDEAFVRSIHGIAQSMGKKTIAEFVESHEIIDLLDDIGVDFAQGYAIAKPQPLDGFP